MLIQYKNANAKHLTGVVNMTNTAVCGYRRSAWISKALQISTTVLLSLFLPLSFLLLSRLSAALSSRLFDDDFNLLVYFNAAVLYSLLSFLAIAAFLRRITGGKVNSIRLLLCPSPAGAAEVGDRRRLSIVWLLICTTVLFSELGVEFLLGGGCGEPPPEVRRSIVCSISRGLLFAVGLYETMMYWSESVVEPVVAAAAGVECGGGERRRTAVERIGLGMSFGALWWWRLRDHVDSLAVVPAAMAVDTGCDVIMKVAEFVSLGLFYLTLFTGAVRVFAGAAGTVRLMVVRRGRDSKAAMRAAAFAETL